MTIVTLTVELMDGTFHTLVHKCWAKTYNGACASGQKAVNIAFPEWRETTYSKVDFPPRCFKQG